MEANKTFFIRLFLMVRYCYVGWLKQRETNEDIKIYAANTLILEYTNQFGTNYCSFITAV